MVCRSLSTRDGSRSRRRAAGSAEARYHQGVDRHAPLRPGDQRVDVQGGQPVAEVDSQDREVHDRLRHRIQVGRGATAAGATVTNDEDRKIFTEDLATGPWFGLGLA